MYKWVIDEAAAPIVRRIFRMTMEGYGPYQIAAQLSDEHIPVPAYHQAQLGVGLWQNREIKNPYKWGSSTIAHILQKHEYLGHTVNFKTCRHFKDKKSHYVDKDQWLVFEDTHEPIIDQETFDNVQRIRGQVRRYPDGWGEAHPLTGLMYCADKSRGQGKGHILPCRSTKHTEGRETSYPLSKHPMINEQKNLKTAPKGNRCHLPYHMQHMLSVMQLTFPKTQLTSPSLTPCFFHRILTSLSEL